MHEPTSSLSICGTEQMQDVDLQSQTIIFCASHLNQSGILSKLRAIVHELLQVQIQELEDKIYALLAVDNIM